MTKRKRDRAPRWFHGGAPGLTAGDMLVPARELSRLPATYAYAREYAELAGGQHVYIVRDARVARAYAGKFPGGPGGGAVYRVEPIGPVEIDPDYVHVPKVFGRCGRARVLEVVEERVTFNIADEVYVQQHATWDNGDPMYDRRGYLQPSVEMRALGITRVDLRALDVLPDPTDSTTERFVLMRAAELGHSVEDVVRITQNAQTRS